VGYRSLDSSDTANRVDGDLVILAVPWSAVSEILTERRDELNGKVVVDITNPVNVERFDSLTVDADSSAAAEIASALPDAQVLKALNINFAATLQSGTVGGSPTTVLIAGDEGAKGRLAEIVTAAGLRAVDGGSLRRARELEAVAFLEMNLAAAEQMPWTGGFALPS
jgi:predicted dinucleotide-binding enzyme